MTDLYSHLWVCSWASGSGKLFLLKSFCQTEQGEIWRQISHITADCSAHWVIWFPSCVCCTGKSWHSFDTQMHKEWHSSKSYLCLFLNKNGLELCFPFSDFLLANLDFVDPTPKCLNLLICNFMPSSELQSCSQTNITSHNVVPRKTEFIPPVVLNTLNNVLVYNEILSKQPFYLIHLDQKYNLTSAAFMHLW